MSLVIEQILNGVQFGVMLFLLAAGLTLIFGIMGMINLAHGSLYMIGAYAAAFAASQTGSFLLAIPAGLAAAGGGRHGDGIPGRAPPLCARSSRPGAGDLRADPVLQRDDLILFGRQPLFVRLPPALNGSVAVAPGRALSGLSADRIIASASLVAGGLYLLINRTRLGMLVRAGATHREMVRALGVDIRLLYTVVFGLGALLAGLAGLMAGPLLAVQVGMGEQILILTFVVVVIGGVGLGPRRLLRRADRRHRRHPAARVPARPAAPGHGRVRSRCARRAASSSMGVYLLMAAVLLVRPKGLFPAHG